LLVLLYSTGGLPLDPMGQIDESRPRMLVCQGAASLLGLGFATWLVGIKLAKLSLTDLRWTGSGRPGRGFVHGILLGLIAAAIALLLSLPLGGARFLPDAGNLTDYLKQAALTTSILAPLALAEEIGFRGVAQVLLAKVFGRMGAIVAISVLFGLAHIFNPNPTPLALANIALAGVFLGAAFYLPGGIWTAWGAHLGWNATLALLDAPVSGLPFPIPLINYEPGGPIWLTGGHFGPEGGLLASITIAAAAAVAWHRGRKAST
jgi:membrane protease YdiL (CAAX protease family)